MTRGRGRGRPRSGVGRSLTIPLTRGFKRDTIRVRYSYPTGGGKYTRGPKKTITGPAYRPKDLRRRRGWW